MLHFSLTISRVSELENRKSAASWFAEGLRERGVEWMATLCGHGLDPLFAAARQAGLRLVDTRNEQTAAYIADA
jgi:thiamine pyrophosphate-dependent acetolactate synthase large subunit-like protein